MKITQRQIDVVYLMQNGYIMIIDRDDFTGRIYYLITKGFERIYINAGTFTRLLDNELIYQQLSHPHDWVLTKKGRELAVTPKEKKNIA